MLRLGVTVSVAVGGDEGGGCWWGTRLTPLKSGATTPPILRSLPLFVGPLCFKQFIPMPKVFFGHLKVLHIVSLVKLSRRGQCGCHDG